MADSDSDFAKEKNASAPPPYAGPGPAYGAPGPAFNQMPQGSYQQPYPQPAPAMMAPGTQVQQQGYYLNSAGQPVYVTKVTTAKHDPYSWGGMQAAIPAMPMPLAIFCCCINFILPGFGTIVASFSVFCCANPGQSSSGRFGCFCLNFWVGWLQLFTIWIFLLGWIWSIMWGMAFITASAELYEARRPVQTTVITETQATYPVGVAATETPNYNTH